MLYIADFQIIFCLLLFQTLKAEVEERASESKSSVAEMDQLILKFKVCQSCDIKIRKLRSARFNFFA